MKLKQTIIVIIHVIIVATLYVKLSNRNDLNDKSLTEGKNRLNNYLKNSVEKEKQTQNKEQMQLDYFETRFTGKKPEEVSEKHWKVFKAILINNWKKIKDINYHCVVLNQFQQPVEGAEVSFELSQIPEDVSKVLTMKKMDKRTNTIVNVSSNEKGLVHLTGVRGDSFSVKNIIKNGYSYVPASKSYGFGIGGRKPQSSIDKPVKLYVIEHDTSEPLYKTSFYTDLPYGELWGMDLFNHTKKNIIRENVMTIFCRQTKENYNTRDWEVTITPIKGHAVSLAHRHSYVASGLASEKMVIRNEDMNYKGHFYLFYHNLEKDHYSKIKIEVSGGRGRARIRAYTFSNPVKGSKNLAYLKEKRLRRWTGVIDPEK